MPGCRASQATATPSTSPCRARRARPQQRSPQPGTARARRPRTAGADRRVPASSTTFTSCPLDRPATELLAELVRALPPHAHLVLSGRRQPPVPLARRRAAGQVVDVGVDRPRLHRRRGRGARRAARADVDDGSTSSAAWPAGRRSCACRCRRRTARRRSSCGRRSSPPSRSTTAGRCSPSATLGWGTTADVEAVAGGGPLDLGALADNGAAHPSRRRRLVRRPSTVGRRRRAHLPGGRASCPATARARRSSSSAARRCAPVGRRVRWGDAEAWRVAARDLVRDTFGALPIDTAQRWLDGVPAAAALAPERRLLELALRHAQRHDDESLADDIDAVVDEFDAGADERRRRRGTGARRPRRPHVWRRASGSAPSTPAARTLAAAASEPVLRFLPGVMRAAVASLRGDVDDAVAAVAGLPFERCRR